MTIMSSSAIVVFFKAWLVSAALHVMGCATMRNLYSSLRIVVWSTKLFTAGKAPRFTASGSNHKLVPVGQPARKNVITGIVLQTPSFAPRTLLGVFCCAHTLFMILFLYRIITNKRFRYLEIRRGGAITSTAGNKVTLLARRAYAAAAATVTGRATFGLALVVLEKKQIIRSRGNFWA